MVRHITLGNQNLLVNIDKLLQVRDIYFPHPGQYNHLVGHAHRIAVLEGKSISWIDKNDWEKKLAYSGDTLITDSLATNKKKKLSLQFNENVYCEDDIFFRKITVKNHLKKQRKLRICFHHDFHLYGDGVGDTAFYDPLQKAIIHYKRSTYFLISILTDKNKQIMSDFDTGPSLKPKLKLRQNPIAKGNVDSLVCIDLDIPANGKKSFYYYLLAGKDLNEIFKLNKKFLKQGVKSHLEHTKMCQKGWLALIKPDISILSKKLQDMYKLSLLIIKTQIDKEGAILAGNDSDNIQYNKDTYSYMWPRDGALVAKALIKAGFSEITKPFFEFCKDVLYHEGCLLHKYNPDKTLGSSWHPWVFNGKPSLPIQEDETALVLDALWTYYQTTHDKEFIKKLYPNFIKPMGNFLAKYRYKNGLPKESYDLWEERRAIFTFTTAATLSGLIAAEKLGHVLIDKKFCEKCIIEHDTIKKAMTKYLFNEKKGYFRRSVSFEHGKIIYDDTIDSSVYGITEFGTFDENDPKVVSTMKNIKKLLWVKTKVGGIARYHDDHYYQQTKNIKKVPGNPWFICTLWYAKWLIRKAQKKSDLKEAMNIINWVADHALPTGLLPEQIHPNTGEPLSVCPLTWSHSEFVDTLTDYINKIKSLKR